MGIRNKINRQICDPANIGIFILAIFLLIVIWYNVSLNNEAIEEPKCMLITSHIYKISDECIQEYYSKYVDNEGFIFSLEEAPPQDCNSTFIEKYERRVYGTETKDQIYIMSLDLYNRIKELGGNALFHKSSLLINTDTNEVIEDHTDTIKGMMDEDIKPKPKGNKSNV